MKKLIASLALLVSVAAFAAYNDTSIVVYTEGPDTYADGTQVLDNECYALCWSAGKFAGIQANGQPVVPTDRILGVFPEAKGGKCSLFKYILTSEAAAGLGNVGNISLWLLDTRVYNGESASVAGTEELTVVNAAKQVQASISLSAPGTGVMNSNEAVELGGGDVTAAPEGTPKASILSITVEKKRIVVVVTNTVPYIAYDLKSGDSPASLKSGAATGALNGKANGIIKLYVDKDEKATQAFFQVDRK